MQKFSGFVSIIGAPNAGKSTLLNAVLGEKLSIVTSKPQTTRNRITGIYSKDNIQIIFTDTPGILEPKYMLQQFMKKEIESGVKDSDIILLITDAGKYDRAKLSELYSAYEKQFNDCKVFCILNKIDSIRKEEILMIIGDIAENFRFDEIIPVSALKNFNTDELLKTIIKYLPQHEFYFESGYITSQPEKFFVSEIIRRNILKLYSDEIPFSVYVDIEEFKEREKGKDYISASVITERETQKSILIGEAGSKIKLLGERSRKNIEEFLGREVFLDLFVKVKKDWKNDEEFLKRNFSKLGNAAN
ncbi:MAG: GTP-binding protein Era [Chlorobi bacterium OLB5]|nr:MAG: GTP-binding protein Era [Chlorobi bacterium OLB5]